MREIGDYLLKNYLLHRFSLIEQKPLTSSLTSAPLRLQETAGAERRARAASVVEAAGKRAGNAFISTRQYRQPPPPYLPQQHI